MPIDAYVNLDEFIERVVRSAGSADLGTDVLQAVAAFAGGFDQTTWTATADSNETGFPPTDALAGYWDLVHGWISGNSAYPHSFIVDMKAPRTFTNVYFTTTFNWGTLGFDPIGWQNYEIYVSTDGVTWGSAIASGTLASAQGQFLITFSSQTKQYIKLVALTKAAGTPPGGGTYGDRAGLLNFFVNTGVGGGGPISTAGSKLVFGTGGGYYIGPLKYIVQNPPAGSTTDLGAIASAEAFGTPTVIPGVVTVSPDGIASAEAFGTPEISSALQVRPTAIDSAEAFGALEVIPGPITVSPSAIASEEAVGEPAVLQTTALRFRIGGHDRTAYLHHESDFSWNLLKGSRGSCSIPLIVGPGDSFTPTAGEFIEIFDPAADRVWAGTIEQVFVRWFGNKGDHLFVVTGVTLESLFEGEVDKTHFDGVTAASAFSDLYTASGVTLVTLGTVDTGDTITALEVTRIADGFSSIALRSNKIWFVDPADLTLNLIASTARSAPWVMTEDEVLWETAQWRQSRADFRDTEVIQSPDGSTQTIIAVTGNSSIGRRALRLTLTTSYTNAGAIQEATAALRRFSTLPSQLVVSTDRPGVSLGMLLEIDVALPLEASGLLNGFWQVIEVEARCLTGMDRVDPVGRRLPDDLELGHFRYTLHLVNSLAFAIFQGDGVTTVFTLPITPGAVSFIRVSPDGGLYATSSLGAAVTITPAMPDGTYGVVGYQGDASPDAGTFMDTWKGMSPTSASAGPTSSSGGAGTAQRYIADATLRDLTVGNDAGPHAIVYHDGSGVRALVVLRKVLGGDLVVRINLAGAELLTIVVPDSTAIDDVLEYPLSARVFTVTIASPGVVTLVGATLANDSPVVVNTSGALPTGLVDGTTYFVVNSTGATFELAATIGGASINTSGTQSGTHWLTSSSLPDAVFTDKDVLTYDILDSDGTIDTSPGGIANITLEWE